MIRKMMASDWTQMQQLLAASPGAAHWVTPPEGIILLAEERGELVGMIAIRAAAGEAEILNIAVAAAWQRRGWGQRLLDAAFAEARADGAGRVFLEVRESNAPARAFYQAVHFAEAHRRRRYYRDPDEDAIVLFRNIE